MAIKQVDIGMGASPEPLRRRYWVLAFAIMLGLGSVPLLFEGTKLCYSKWMEALERPVEVRTPILDRISDKVNEFREGAFGNAHTFFERAAWDPKIVLVVAICVMMVAMLLLRS